MENPKSIHLARGFVLTSLITVLLILSAPAQTGSSGANQKRALVISNVRVFDGERVIQRATAVVQGGKIVAVSSSARIPAGAEVINGTGMTLLPGLIDSYTLPRGRPSLRQSLIFGVTTNLGMFTPNPQPEVDIRREQAEGKATNRADLFSAGVVVTVPGGHGTQYGVPIPTINESAQAQAFVDARIAEGSDYIASILDDVRVRHPSLSLETLKAVIMAAKRRGKLAVVHVGVENNARQAIEAEADGLIRLYCDGQPDVSFARLAKSRGAFVISSLTEL
jgi:dihydroorotase-like cyclic amidohydrolase